MKQRSAVAESSVKGVAPFIALYGSWDQPKSAKPSLKVECLECGRRFTTKSLVPSCPRCGGSDIDLA